MGLHTGESEERDGNYFGPPGEPGRKADGLRARGAVVVLSSDGGVGGRRAARRSGNHRLPDLSAPQRLFQVGPWAFLRPCSLDTFSTNLPVVWTDLIGRDSDITELSELLHGHRP